MQEFEEINIDLGANDKKQLTAAKVLVKGLTKVSAKGNDKIVLYCKHPEQDQLLKISSVKAVNSKGRLQISGCWISYNDTGAILSTSALGRLLDFYGCYNVKDIVGKHVDTTYNDEGYLVVKAYE